jgi:chromosome transmission fidelity protein 18
MVQKATRGMKEADQSFTSVLSDIFSPLSNSRVKDLGLTTEEEARYVGRISRGIEGTGSLDKVALGSLLCRTESQKFTCYTLACFEHYATLRTHDGSFRAYEQGQDWLQHTIS